MKAGKLFLAVSAVLFVGWIGFLAYLVFTAIHPTLTFSDGPKVRRNRIPVLSRPQLHEADVVVSARLEAQEGPATGPQILWGRQDVDRAKVEESVRLLVLTHYHGYDGPQSYLLPLVKVGPGYQLATIPTSPGWPPARPLERRNDSLPVIYPDTSDTRSQLKAILGVSALGE